MAPRRLLAPSYITSKFGLSLFFSIAALSNSYADQGVRIALEKYDRKAEVAIQRGYSIATAACVSNLVSSIRTYAGKHSGWFITFDSDEAVYFDSPKIKKFRHRCVDGRQITTENGQDEVVQVFDEYGKPTMAER